MSSQPRSDHLLGTGRETGTRVFPRRTGWAGEPTNLTPYVQGGLNSFYAYRADMSLAPVNQPPAPLTAVTVVVLHPGAGLDFVSAIKKANDALNKQADWSKTSDFARLPKNVTDVLSETYGKETADQIQKTIRDCTARQYTEAASYRSDLCAREVASYFAPGARKCFCSRFLC